MISPIRRIQRGAIVLAVIMVISTVGYRFLGSYDWIEALWLVVITISTVGYGEQSTFEPAMQVFTIFVIVFGISASVYTFGGMVQFLFEGELDTILGKRRMQHDLASLRDHVIICGFGRIGLNLASELAGTHHEFVVIDQEQATFNETDTLEQKLSHPIHVVGDATAEATLISVGVERAKTLVSALPSDAENVFITLSARNLNQNLQIIARAEHESTEKKLRQAGADLVVMPTVVGARQMARMITRPATAELIDLVSQRAFDTLELDECFIPQGSRLVSMTVGDTRAACKEKLLIVAIKSPSGDLNFNPQAAQACGPEDVIIIMGHARDIEWFRREFGLTSAMSTKKMCRTPFVQSTQRAGSRQKVG